MLGNPNSSTLVCVAHHHFVQIDAATLERAKNQGKFREDADQSDKLVFGRFDDISGIEQDNLHCIFCNRDYSVKDLTEEGDSNCKNKSLDQRKIDVLLQELQAKNTTPDVMNKVVQTLIDERQLTDSMLIFHTMNRIQNLGSEKVNSTSSDTFDNQPCNSRTLSSSKHSAENKLSAYKSKEIHIAFDPESNCKAKVDDGIRKTHIILHNLLMNMELNKRKTLLNLIGDTDPTSFDERKVLDEIFKTFFNGQIDKNKITIENLIYKLVPNEDFRREVNILKSDIDLKMYNDRLDSVLGLPEDVDRHAFLAQFSSTSDRNQILVYLQAEFEKHSIKDENVGYHLLIRLLAQTSEVRLCLDGPLMKALYKYVARGGDWLTLMSHMVDLGFANQIRAVFKKTIK